MQIHRWKGSDERFDEIFDNIRQESNAYNTNIILQILQTLQATLFVLYNISYPKFAISIILRCSLQLC